MGLGIRPVLYDPERFDQTSCMHSLFTFTHPRAPVTTRPPKEPKMFCAKVLGIYLDRNCSTSTQSILVYMDDRVTGA